MSLTEESFQLLKKEVTETARNAERAQGALDVLMRQLREKWGCQSLAEAEKKLKELTKAEEVADAAFTEALEDYERRWKKP